MNAYSILCHLEGVPGLVNLQHLDIASVNPGVVPQYLILKSLPSYSIYRSDCSRSSGDIGVYVADHPLSCGAPCGEVESLWLSIIFFKPSLSSFAFGCIYCPPSAPSTSVSDLCSIVESLMLSHKHIVACGNLNGHFWLNPPFHQVASEFINTHSMSYPISQPTHISETRCSRLIRCSYLPLHCSQLSHFWSLAHCPLHSLVCPWPALQNHYQIDVLLRSLTLPHSTKTLLLCPGLYSTYFDDVDDLMLVFAFNSLFSGVFDCHAQTKTVHVKKNCAP